MDVFAFASHSETQGMVLAEAMMAGVPVVALDAPGVREVVRQGVNGRLLFTEGEAGFAAALSSVASMSTLARQRLVAAARKTAEEFSMPRCAKRIVALYESLLEAGSGRQPADDTSWAALLRLIGEEWNIWSRVGRAVGDALLPADKNERAAG
jgi:glycogen synthase